MDKEFKMVFSGEIEAERHYEMPDAVPLNAVPLDPEGDVILVANDPACNAGSNFLVSSRVLELVDSVISGERTSYLLRRLAHVQLVRLSDSKPL